MSEEEKEEHKKQLEELRKIIEYWEAFEDRKKEVIKSE